jgi:hypothetical protein
MGCLFCGGARCTVAPDARRIARSGRLLKLGRSASSIQRTRPHPDRCGRRRWTLKNTGLSVLTTNPRTEEELPGVKQCTLLLPSSKGLWNGGVTFLTLEFDGYPE